jgi:hypothetical protein
VPYGFVFPIMGTRSYPASQPAAAIWGRALIDEFQNVGQIYGDVILTLCFKCVNWVDLPSNAA